MWQLIPTLINSAFSEYFCFVNKHFVHNIEQNLSTKNYLLKKSQNQG